MAEINSRQVKPVGARAAYNDADEPACRPYIRPTQRRKRRIRRAVLAFGAFLVSVICIGLIAGGIFFGRLAQGPIALDLGPQIMATLNEKVGHGYAFELGGTSIAATDHGPALTIDKLSVKDSADRPVITAPKAEISVDPMALLVGKVIPKRLSIRDIDLRLLTLPNGQVAVSAGTGGSAAFPLSSAFSGASRAAHAGSGSDVDLTKASPPEPSNAAVRALAASLRSLVQAATAPDSALGALESVDISGRLVLEDRVHHTSTVFNNTELGFDKARDGSANLSVAADGPAGRWSLVARATQAENAAKSLTVEVHDLSLDEITLAGGLHSLGFDFDMPVSASMSFHLDANGELAQADGQFSLGAGYFKLDDPDHEPLLVDWVKGGFRLDKGLNGLEIERTELRAGDSDFIMTGHVDLPRSAGEPWTIKTQASGVFGTERPGEKPIKIARTTMAFRVLPAEGRFLIDRVEVSGPEVAFEMSGDVQTVGSGFRLRNTCSVKHMPAPALVRLWPSFIAAPVRAWLLANLKGGTVEHGTSTVDLTDQDLATMRAQHSVADDRVHVSYAVSNLSLSFMAGVPALVGVDGTGTVTGHTANFTVSRAEMEVAPGRRLSLPDGSFNVADTDPKPTPATVSAHVTGSIDAVADLLSRDALKPYANLPIDASAIKGQVDAHVGVSLLLGDHIPPEETKVTASAVASGFVAEKLIGKESLVDGNLQLVADRSGLRAKGEGRMFGAPASIELKKGSGGGPGDAVINLSLDDAARAKAGINLGKSLTGIVAAHISTSLPQGDKSKAAVELDFSRAAIEGLVPGFTKALGKPGKATFSVVQHEGRNSLDNIVFEGGGATVRGSAELDSNGGFNSADLTQVRLSPGDEMRLEATRSGDILKLDARGANMDARPFLHWLGASGRGGGSESADSSKNIDLELHATVLTGQNSQAVTGADLRLSRRGGQIKSLQFTGRFGRQPLSVTTAQGERAPVFMIKSADAGGALSFMDLYKRMLGGRLDANLSFTQGRLEGSATVRDFTLREDPAIKKLATEGLAVQSRTRETASIDPSSVPFTKLEAHFSKSGNRVSVRDGALYGPEVGATVEGTLDFGRDQVSLAGTFVPLYGVNNLFSQIPLFGPLLGGGEREGLFGLNYTITGSPTAPVLNVNPLSAMAPGFLRKIFGAIDNAAQGAGEPRDRADGASATGATPPRDRASGASSLGAAPPRDRASGPLSDILPAMPE